MEAAGHATSFISLFWQAHIVVKAVMVGLMLASIMSWAIIFEKTTLYAKYKRALDKFETQFWSGQSLDELFRKYEKKQPSGYNAIFQGVMNEWYRTHESNSKTFLSLRERLDKIMDTAISRESEALSQRLTFLATVGASAPFIGLFGTVWGIMTAFQAIAASQNTNLAVVAPGIAEALFATAIGLVAAIPSVIAYNKFSSDSARLIGRLEDFSDEFATLLYRQIDERQP